MSVGLAVGLTLLTLGLVVAAGAVVGLGLLARCLTTTLTLTTTLIITLTLAITFLSFNISSPYIISPHRHPTVTPTVTPTINPTVTHPRYLTRTRGDYYTQVGRAAPDSGETRIGIYQFPGTPGNRPFPGAPGSLCFPSV